MSDYDGFKGGFDLTAAMQSFRDNPAPHGKKQFFRQLKGAKLLVPYQGDAMNVAALHILQVKYSFRHSHRHMSLQGNIRSGII